jgi:uncharacterized protein YjiS (DUF1127 family)
MVPAKDRRAAPRGAAAARRRDIMATLTPLRARPAARAGSSLARAANSALPLIARLAATFARARRIRRDTRQLMALSDHMLRDLGLDRAEVERTVGLGRDRR